MKAQCMKCGRRLKYGKEHEIVFCAACLEAGVTCELKQLPEEYLDKLRNAYAGTDNFKRMLIGDWGPITPEDFKAKK